MRVGLLGRIPGTRNWTSWRALFAGQAAAEPKPSKDELLKIRIAACERIRLALRALYTHGSADPRAFQQFESAIAAAQNLFGADIAAYLNAQLNAFSILRELDLEPPQDPSDVAAHNHLRQRIFLNFYIEFPRLVEAEGIDTPA